MILQRVESIEDPRVADYGNVRDAELLRERGLFMVEGRSTLLRALENPAWRPRSVLVSEAARDALAEPLAALPDATPVYLAPRRLIEDIAGFDVHRGCLAACERPAAVAPADLLPPPGRPSVLVVLEGLSDPDNVGAVFRNAMAFGVDAVLLSPHCCDPLYRKAIRVSIGASLRVPFARVGPWPEALGALPAAGYRVVALHPGPGSLDLVPGSGQASAPSFPERVALVLGTEGAGLSAGVLERADLCVRVGMTAGFDCINVATAAAIVLHHLHAVRGKL